MGDIYILRDIFSQLNTFRHKDIEPLDSSTNLLDKQLYLQSLLGDGINEANWNKAMKFIGKEVKGDGIVKKLKTDGGMLYRHADIARYFNEKFTLQTHDPKKLQMPYTEQHGEVNTKFNVNIALLHT